MTTVIGPRLQSDLERPARLARSAGAAGAAGMTTEEVPGWLVRHREAHGFRVRRIPLSQLDGWAFSTPTGNLVHHTGRFFSVEGLHVTREGVAEWRQPIIVQPEIGILGILAKEIDGVLHVLMQAKMEPGNPNLVQLSPTVQATRSNYTKVHQGSAVPYLDYFTKRESGRVLVDVLQSEHGAWFFRKSNRNMIVEVDGDVPLREGFRWLTLGQLGTLLRHNNVVNMDVRTVLACARTRPPEQRALLSDTELLSWFTGERCRHDVRASRIPLADVTDWVRSEMSIDHVAGRYFRVAAVAVAGGAREVARWSQPLIEPVGDGVAAFLLRHFDGVPHVLAHARVEGGFLDTVELAPTVQCIPANYAHLPAARRPRFLDEVLAAEPARIRYQAVHSEEGGRFFNAESRYLVVEADDAMAPAQPPPGYCWVTPDQLTSLLRHGHYVNVQARTLLAAINTRATDLS